MNELLALGFILGFFIFIAESIVAPIQAWLNTLPPVTQLMVSNGAFILGSGGMIFMLYWLTSRFIGRQVAKKSLKQLQKMNPFEFEQYVAEVLKANGYRRVRVTGKSNDGGKDIVCYDRVGRKCVVEVKRYADQNLVGRPLIQKLHSCMIHEKAPRALFITTSDFNQNAKEYASGKNIELINGTQFLNLIK